MPQSGRLVSELQACHLVHQLTSYFIVTQQPAP